MRKITALLILLAFTPVAHTQTGPGSQGQPLATAPSGVHGVQQVLGTLRGANFNSTSDQPIAIFPQITKWAVTSIWVTNCSISMTTAQGGFYPAASKGGTALVASSQAYTGATASTIIVAATLASNIATTDYTISTVYLSLTTAQGAAATCDVYVIGIDLT